MLATWAKEYIGIPFSKHGRDRELGIDCWGLICLIYSEQYDVELNSYVGGENRNSNAQIFNAEKDKLWKPCLAMNGAVVLLNIAARACHAGVVVGDGKFIHAQERVGVVMEQLQSVQWHNRIEGFYNYDG